MIKVTKLSEKQQREKQERQEEQQQRITLKIHLSNAIVEEAADSEDNIEIVEQIIKKCKNPECIACAFLKETITYLKTSLNL